MLHSIDRGDKRSQEYEISDGIGINSYFFDGRPDKDEKILGIKTFGTLAKNSNSKKDYHMISNLSTEKHTTGISYDGVNR